MIYYLMGKSASGKDSIFHKLLEKGHFQRLIPYTTRPMREGEAEGQEYHFISEEEFEKLISTGEMAEYRVYDTVFGKWYYGTVLPEEAESAVQADKTERMAATERADKLERTAATEQADETERAARKRYLAIGTLESYLQLKAKLGERGIFPLYIEVPDEIRLERAFLRQEGGGKKTREEILRRFKADDEDFSEDKLAQAGIRKRYPNTDLTECAKEIEQDTVLSECTREIEKDTE